MALLVILGLSACAGFPSDPWGPAATQPAQLPSPTTRITPAGPPTRTPAAGVDPLASPTPGSEACLEKHGRFEEETLASEEMGKDLAFRVYLPPCYIQSMDRSYPVIYLFHGQSFQSDQWDRLGIDEAAERMAAAGEAPPVIMVFPSDPDWRQPTQIAFDEAIAEELVPWVDAHYRTLADREQRAVGGLSRGAGWAVHLAFNYPDLFSRVGAHSLALFWVDSESLPLTLRDLPVESLPNFYLDAGRSDRELRSTQEFEALLTAHNITHEWVLNLGYHDETYWSDHVEQYLRFYTRDWLASSPR